MPYVLYATGAALILSIIGNMLLAVKLSNARIERDDALDERDHFKSENADAELCIKAYHGIVEAQLTRLAELEAAEARRMAPLIAANAERKAKAANGRIGA